MLTGAIKVLKICRVLKRTTNEDASTYLSDFGEHELHTPDFSLAAKSVLAAKSELLIETLLLVRTSDRTEGLSRYKQTRIKQTNNTIEITKSSPHEIE